MFSEVRFAESIEDAAATLAADDAARPFAGGTWIMRAPIRQEPLAPLYVAIGRIAALRALEATPTKIAIGACATHAEIAAFLARLPEFAGLRAAAAHSANPAVRDMATIGGNLCATAFAASDFAPALLSLDARVHLAGSDGESELSIEAFLATRARPGLFLTRVTVPRSPRRSAHVRLPLRKAGDYPVAVVGISADIAETGVVNDPRIAIGSVEPVARRWTSLERAIAGSRLDPQAFSLLARELLGDFTGRDGVEAPGWYRVEVLPSLIAKAFAQLSRERD